MYTEIVGHRPKEGSEYYEAWYARWPDMYDFNMDPDKVGDLDCLFTIVTYMENNVKFTARGTEFSINEMTAMFGIEKNNVGYSTSENPFFANPGAGDYTIVKNADNFTNPIDFANIGRY